MSHAKGSHTTALLQLLEASAASRATKATSSCVETALIVSAMVDLASIRSPRNVFVDVTPATRFRSTPISCSSPRAVGAARGRKKPNNNNNIYELAELAWIHAARAAR